MSERLRHLSLSALTRQRVRKWSECLSEQAPRALVAMMTFLLASLVPGIETLAMDDHTSAAEQTSSQERARTIPDLVAYRLLFRAVAKKGAAALSTCYFDASEIEKLVALAQEFDRVLEKRDQEVSLLAANTDLSDEQAARLTALKGQRDALTRAFLYSIRKRLGKEAFLKLGTYTNEHVKPRIQAVKGTIKHADGGERGAGR